MMARTAGGITHAVLRRHGQGQLKQHAARNKRSQHLHGVDTQPFLHGTHGFFNHIFRHPWYSARPFVSFSVLSKSERDMILLF